MKKILLLLAICGLFASCQNKQINSTTPQNTPSANMQSGNENTSATQPLITPDVIKDKAPIGKTDDGAITYGNGSARLQIFADFQCPACQQADASIIPVLDELAEAGKLTIEYRQFPLTQIHNNAFADANAALCSADQNVYRQYKHALYELERSKRGGRVSNDDYITLAKNLGINEAEFSKCVTEQTHKARVEADMKLGNSLGVTGTPTFLLDGQQLSMSAFTSTKKDQAENIAEFQQKLKKFLEDYVEKTSKTANPVITTDETPVQDDTNHIGGVVSTEN